MDNYFGPNIKLLRKRRKRTQDDVAFALKIKRTTVNAIENRISRPTIEQLQVFSSYFKFAIDTLINVNLEQLSESQLRNLEAGTDVFIRGSNLRVLATSINTDNEENIELVSAKAKAGYSSGYADTEYISKLPAFQLPFLSKNKKYRAFTLVGDSMLPVPEGAIVIGEFVQDYYNIKTGKAYVILTQDDGIVFKLIENTIPENGTLVLKSLNTRYEPYSIPVNEVKELWKFTLFLNFELPSNRSEFQHIMSSLDEIKTEIIKIGETK